MILSLVLYASLAMANVEPVKANCLIKIKMLKRTGDWETLDLRAQVKSKAACKKRASLHKRNYSVSTVKRQSVTYKWLD